MDMSFKNLLLVHIFNFTVGLPIENELTDFDLLDKIDFPRVQERSYKFPLYFRWPNATVPYRISPSIAEETNKDRILKAFQLIEENSCIKFVPANEEDINYLLFTDSEPYGHGCYSDRGLKPGGVTFVNLAKGCWVSTAICSTNADQKMLVICPFVSPTLNFSMPEQ